MTTTNSTPPVESSHFAEERAEAAAPAVSTWMVERPWHLRNPMLEDLTNYAQDVYAGLVSVLDDAQLAPAARLQWEACHQVLEHYSSLEPAENVVGRRYGYAMALDALAASPEAVSAAMRLLRALLVEGEPALALLAKDTPPPDAAHQAKLKRAAYNAKLQQVCDDVDAYFDKRKQAEEGNTPPA